MISSILEYPSDTVVVTGGEPLMWDMTYLTQSLKIKGLKTHLETSGSNELSANGIGFVYLQKISETFGNNKTLSR